ncbi:carboxy terminal-processing peptidase [Thalassolituus sp. UBA3500]|uniref:carboxy terminal-processing peptidase n=1 Tax=Thalassolituus sp. UBA3500 TaxID=1947664 RepID=UPI000C0D64DD|nr:carboxy terminal-processing peptidase [Thalassolituus sp. UBA3500]MBN59258.1 tail-specific protease [Oceanospirillaceae bacterium]|tara:strand:+ start:2482 stop:4605 length:2124 start_codon:yes stop_codon:yes gene_type:complete
MMHTGKRLLLSATAVVLTLIGISANATIPEIKPGTPFTPLEPTREEAITTQQIMSNLLRGHYERKRLNNDLSSEVLNTLLDDLDGTHSYFLASDIEEFEQFRNHLDEALSRGDMKPAFYIYNRFQQRVSERLSFMLNELEKKAKDYDFKSKEVLELDREDTPWASTRAELDQLWRKRLKNSMLNLRLAGKEDEDILELLTKRYQNQLNRVHQSRPVDAYQTFMNAVTRTFDPHTQYFSPRNSENFNINMSLSLQGIGAVLQTEDEHTKVVRLVPGGPASKAGNLEPEDKIIGVAQGDEEMVDVIGWRLDEVVDLIRGPKSSTVRLEILSGAVATAEPKTIAIVRDEVKLEEQSAQKEVIEIQDGKDTRRIGVIDIPTFYIDFEGRMNNLPDYRSTTRDVRRLVNELLDEKIDGLIIDLRSNGGGSLEEAINLTGLFIPTGPVVQVRGARGDVDVLRDRDPEVLYAGPMTVLVNRLSASASEIFAGAVQDYGRGLVIGGQTFGKGTVQSLRPLTEGQLKITQAKFYRVSGDSTQNQGVIPDIMFPSLFDKDKIGESALEKALPWDTIKPARETKSNPVRSKLSRLKELHEERINDNPDFIFVREQKALVSEMRDKTQVSLNEEERKAEREENDRRRLALENKRRKAKGMPELASLDDPEEDEKVEGDEEKDKSAEEKDDEEPDAMLIETGNILLDYMRMSSPGMTALR